MQLLGQERWLAGYPNAGIANRPTCQTRFWPGRQYTNLLGWLQERLVGPGYAKGKEEISASPTMCARTALL